MILHKMFKEESETIDIKKEICQYRGKGFMVSFQPYNCKPYLDGWYVRLHNPGKGFDKQYDYEREFDVEGLKKILQQIKLDVGEWEKQRNL